MDQATRCALAARAGQSDAFAELVALTQAPVWQFCAYLCDAGSADDLTQETFLRAYRALPGFRGTSTVRAWLFVIARRVVADELAGRARRSRSARDLAAAGTVSVADESERVALTALVGRLEPQRRAAFVLTQLLGFSYREAAEICGCPVGTIRSRVARARADLMPWLREERPGRAAGG